MSQRKVKAAVIGVGLIGEQHAEAYHEYPRSELVYVMDLDSKRAWAVGERFGCRYTTDIEEVAASEVDVVSVATPDFAHFQPTMRMIEAGKHVVVEKPLATSVREARQMAEAARRRGVKMTVNLGLRWSPGFLTVRDSIRSGEIGEPIMAHVRLADTIWVPRKMLSWAGKSGPQWFLFAHTMDLLRWFLGQEAQEVYAVGTKRVLAAEGINAYDAIQALVRFERTFVTFETAWILPEAWPDIVESEMTIYGSRGRLHFDAKRQGFELSSDEFGKHMFARPALWKRFKLPSTWWGALRSMVDCVLDGGEPAIPAEDGLAVTAMIEAVERSIQEDRPISPRSLIEGSASS
ncbi:MAG: Gfo/Idh/MocA family oxidoreductase [Anaerolineae bacterium]|nr:Gfo/Idh/MocA family oxidoreductase [Anaerolineae bacterium]